MQKLIKNILTRVVRRFLSYQQPLVETFGELEEKLPRNQFCRVHKSFMLAIDKIESIEQNNISIQKEIIPVSETYRESFYKLLKYPSK
jgi:DNA-binding LytR/AlgR family response regulator